ncbi:cytochrome C biogenesis protein CcmA [Pseudolabrys sp. Root1462]|uniref:heme ABC exporter ATP-binding protein CcmA n=1 Tax=Pseudolabrys sp. Root1462 TaxID=1736466 RepID=UPI000702ADE2|nr:heme ABC exporter ATP-binding protein CcmA [Pseudolabrys sp. Root1462]KQY98027.1 cytochrome C biogenesis protein CcmA [Pseudolabrys sp. Root1462]
MKSDSAQLICESLACERGGRQVFSDVSFAVPAGEALIVTGRNGSGKSTLLRVIAGLLRAAAGRIELSSGVDEASVAEQAHYLGHLDAAKPSLTVAENLQFWARFLGAPAAASLEPALEAVELATLADLPAAYLSAGQRRRLSIARLLAVKRPVWLLDEPTSALDAQSQGRLAAFMRDHLAGGGIIVAATHGPIGLDHPRELKMGIGR